MRLPSLAVAGIDAMNSPTVFISYSHDSPEHADRVLDLSDRLRHDGIECIIDQYETFPPDGWPKWMDKCIENSDFILIICTETYYRRVMDKEVKGKGLGVKWESTLTYNHIYYDDSKNSRFIPVLFDPQNRQYIPNPLKGAYFCIDNDEGYEMLYRHLTNQPITQKPDRGKIRKLPPRKRRSGLLETQTIVSLAKLPSTSHDLFGREKELEILDKAWDIHTNIVSIVAFGGTGKTALVNAWLNKMAKNDYKGAERVLGWSFYSQGTSEDKQASADQFIAYALRWFGDPNPNEGSPWDKGERLAELVKAHKTLLILDGLEPLQYPPGEMEGKLRDPSIECLLKELAHSNKGLCIITTRIQVDDIKDDIGDSVEEIELENLSPDDGAKLLETLGVDGTPDELKEVVADLDGHALALTLLGTYLKTVYHGDIRRRKEIPKLTESKKQGAHARRVMESYEIWFKGKPELDILYIMGLFDRPAEWGAIQALRDKPVIEGLTSKLENLTPADWRFALDNLRTARLLSDEDKNKPDDLDCHPLVREHFGEKLKANNPKAWKEAHNRLYDWYKSHAKELPDTLEEMTPLYQAVSHGCHASRWQEALDEIYSQRILRVNEFYSTRKLGAFGSDLSAISGFFSELWSKPVDGLSEDWKAFILNAAGFRLRGLGRLAESAQPMQASLEADETRKKWDGAAISANNLSELYLTIGDLAESVIYGEQCVELADKSEDAFWRFASRTALADALHQSGMIEKAEELFKSAEDIQKEDTPEYPILYSVQGYQYCDLLLGQGQYQEVLKRAGQMLKWEEEGRLLDIALDHLALGRAYMLIQEEKSTFTDAEAHLQQAVDGLRQAGTQHHIPRGLLAHASLYIIRKDYSKAQHDIDSGFSIAKRGSMGLHQADCHLAYARLYYAKGDSAKAKEHLTTAKEMINRMGYHRRDKEVEELECS